MTTRLCEICGQGYNRRNATELWIRQNPHHRTGWVKRIMRICTWCQNAQQTGRVLNVVRISVVPKKASLEERESA